MSSASEEATWVMVALMAIMGFFKACEHLSKNGFIMKSPFCSFQTNGDDHPSSSNSNSNSQDPSPAAPPRPLPSSEMFDPIALSDRLSVV